MKCTIKHRTETGRKNCSYCKTKKSKITIKPSIINGIDKQENFKGKTYADAALTQQTEITDIIAPEWFNNIKNNYSEKLGDPTIIDTITLPNDKPGYVIYEKNSTHEHDAWIPLERGLRCMQISYYDEEGKEVGYIKAVYATPETRKLSWGNDEWTGLRYLQEFGGGNYGMVKDYDKKNKDLITGELKINPLNDINSSDSDKRILAKKNMIAEFARSNRNFKEPSPGKWYLDVKDLPDNEEELNKDIKRMQSIGNNELKAFMLRNNKAFIDFSKINDDYAGHGLGQALYIHLGKQLQKEGKYLHSSGIQSDQAEALWRRLAKNPNLQLKEVPNYDYKAIIKRDKKGNETQDIIKTRLDKNRIQLKIL